MDVLDVTDRIKEIRKYISDPERAHGLEDTLHIDVLYAIGHGIAGDARALALETLKTQAITYPRWKA